MGRGEGEVTIQIRNICRCAGSFTAKEMDTILRAHWHPNKLHFKSLHFKIKKFFFFFKSIYILMSCLGPYYSPIPAREWSRVQNQCTDLI